jgi:hypothetical protein
MPTVDENGNPIDPENGNGSQNQNPEKTFTQAEVDSIIAARLGREGIHDAKEIVELLKDFGYEGTPAEIKVVLREQAKVAKAEREQATKQKELEDLQDQAKQTGTSPELLAEIKALKSEIAELKQKDQEKTKEVEEKQKADQHWNDMVKEFNDKYPDIDLDKLGQNQKFYKFFQNSNPSLTLAQVYENYVELVGETEKSAIEKVKSNLERSTSSGKNKGNANDGGTYGLTARQQALADEAGISYKKYADGLALIKK